MVKFSRRTGHWSWLCELNQNSEDMNTVNNVVSSRLCCRYFLQPRSHKNHPYRKSPGNSGFPPGAHQDSLGTLRLNIHYTADHVFSSHVYDPLRQLILQSTQIEVGHWLSGCDAV
jgi:hypothetical protein